MSCTNWAQWVIKNKRSRKEEEEEEKKEGEEKGDKEETKFGGGHAMGNMRIKGKMWSYFVENMYEALEQKRKIILKNASLVT